MIAAAHFAYVEAHSLSRRTIAYCLSDEQPEPETVMLAPEGRDRRAVA